MDTETEKIKDVLKNSKSIALLLQNNPKEHEILSREALFINLKEKNLDVSIFPDNQEEFYENWGHIISARHHQINKKVKTTSILIPKKLYEAKEVHYDEDSNFLSLNISSNQIINKENVIFKEKLPSFDAVFLFGSNNIDEIKKYEDSFKLPLEEKIFYLTNNENTTLSKKVSEIIEGTNDSLANKTVSNLILASLLTETGATENRKKEGSLSFIQLFGRALARTRINNNLQSSWTFISKEDLEKTDNTGAGSRIFYKILKKYRETVVSPPLSVLIWQGQEKVWSIITEEKPQKYLSSLAKKFGANMENGFFITGPFNNFSEAEIKIQQNIKDVVKII